MTMLAHTLKKKKKKKVVTNFHALTFVLAEQFSFLFARHIQPNF